MTSSPLVIERNSSLSELLEAATTRFTQLLSEIHSNPNGGIHGDGVARIVLTGGTAGIALLERLAEVPAIDWSRVHVFFGDERNVPVDHPESNEGQARAALLAKVAIPEEHIHGYGLRGGAMDEATTRYISTLKKQAPKGFDLHLLGMGGEGHINSLFPCTPAVNEEEKLVVAVHDSPKPPAERVSLTLPAVRRANEVWFLVSGEEKAEAAAQIVRHADANDWPAAGAYGKQRTILYITEDAASSF